MVSSDLDAFLAAQPDLAAALPGLERAAASDAPLLILGEPGSGRTTLARLMHAAGRRATAPLVEVDAGVIPAPLAESELFGHRAGAFTGAVADSPGRVGRAAGGSLLLDRVEELPLAVQPKLLRVLSERRYTPLGGDERSCDVRFIAVAGEDLPWRVDNGAFRRDLFYRLEVLAFRLPPLRRRQRDFDALVEAMLTDLAARFDRPQRALTASAERWMRRHPWPGNLRQLRNLLERAVVLAEGSGALDPPPPEDADAGLESLAELEAAHLRRVLARTRGHQGRAAQLLGISRKTLWEKRKRHGIP